MSYKSTTSRVYKDAIHFLCWCPYEPALLLGVSLRWLPNMGSRISQEARLLAVSLESCEQPKPIFETYLPMDKSHGEMIAIRHHGTRPLVACLFENAVYVWDYELSNIVGYRKFDEKVTNGGFCPDWGHMWLSLGRVWAEWYFEARVGYYHEYMMEDDEYGGSAALHPSGLLIAVSRTGEVDSGYYIHKNLDHRFLYYFLEPAMSCPNYTSAPVFSPWGEHLALVTPEDSGSSICIYELKTANCLLKIPVTIDDYQIPPFLQFGEDGATITLRQKENNFTIFDTRTGQQLYNQRIQNTVTAYSVHSHNGMYAISYGTGWLEILQNDAFSSQYTLPQIFIHSRDTAEAFTQANALHLRRVEWE